MTVDRTHVLATPGMDRHGGYVAMSRHREGMALHYGKDDFANREKLERTLSRDRSKDMATDYERRDPRQADPARDFAERRGITVRERVEKVIETVKQAPEKAVELVKQVPEKTRGMFDGLRLSFPKPSETRQKPQREPERGVKRDGQGAASQRQNPFASFRPDRASPAKDSAREPTKEAQAGSDRTRDLAVQRHARAVARIFDMQDKNLPTLPHQTTELAKAREELKSLGDNAVKDMEAAYRRDPSLARETAVSGRTGPAIEAMGRERQARTGLEHRADQFVKDWNNLEKQSQQQYKIGDMSSYRSTRGSMAEMAKGLERDPQLDSILANRKQQLGIGVGADTGRSLGKQLAFAHGLDMGRGRGLGL
jgi:hypothetical protein